MTEGHRLPALVGSHPLGALASFGLLRLVSEWDKAARLHFRMEDDWIAVLQAPSFPTLDALVEELDKWSHDEALDGLLGWAKDVRVSPEEYRRLVAEAISDTNPLRANFLSAIACDGAVDSQKSLVKPSAFYMVSGQQSFLSGMREIVAEIRSTGRASFDEALVGPWRYVTRKHGMGWDPNAERMHALRHRAPTAEKPSCIAGAVLLAFWAIPLMPAVSNKGRAFTIGFSRQRDEQRFAWPIFSTPLGIAELTSLLRSGRRSWLAEGQTAFRRGIDAVFECRRFEFGQGYAVFRAARSVTAASIAG